MFAKERFGDLIVSSPPPKYPLMMCSSPCVQAWLPHLLLSFAQHCFSYVFDLFSQNKHLLLYLFKYGRARLLQVVCFRLRLTLVLLVVFFFQASTFGFVQALAVGRGSRWEMQASLRRYFLDCRSQKSGYTCTPESPENARMPAPQPDAFRPQSLRCS